MMTLLLAYAVTVFTPTAGSAIHIANNVAAVTMPTDDDPIRRGEAIGDSPTVLLDSIIVNPDAYDGKSIVVEGTVGAVCTRKGCWMEVAPAKGRKGVRVTFKDYGFFVPTNSQGMRVKAEGEVKVNILSAEDVEHYLGEGASIDPRPDGTALEITFVATGVELRKE